MNLRRIVTFSAITAILLIAACAPVTPVIPQTGGETRTPAAGSGTGEPGAPIVSEEDIRGLVAAWLGQQLNIPGAQVDAVSVIRNDWPDACLGLPQEGEQCAQVITPGWRLVLRANGQDYVVRSNLTGTVIRLAPMGSETSEVGDGTVEATNGVDEGTVTAPGVGTGTVEPGAGTPSGTDDDTGTGTGQETDTVGGTSMPEVGGTPGDEDGIGTGQETDTVSGTSMPEVEGTPSLPGAGTGTSTETPRRTGTATGGTGPGAGQSGTESGNIQLFFVRLEDNGQSGQLVGCGDSLVAVDSDVTASADVANNLRLAYRALFETDSADLNEQGLYTAFTTADLRLESVSFNNGSAIVRLFGDYTLGGECDGPRVEAQLESIAQQFDEVNEVEIYLNDEILSDALSLEGDGND